MKVTADVPDPGDAMEAGLKLTVTPVGAPEDDSAIAELNPPETAVVMVDVPLLPGATETATGEAASVNAGVGVVEPLVSAASRPLLGLPHPVTRSYPVVAA